MFNLIIISLQVQCVDYNFIDFPKNLSDIQSGISIQITNEGINNYFQKNIMFSGDWLIKAQISDIDMTINPFKIQFTDIKITDYHLPTCESTYPYFEDKGTATLKIVGINIAGLGSLVSDQTCPLHYFLNMSDPITNVYNISVTLDGKLAAIYNSILSTITDNLIQQFNRNLGPIIVNALLAVGNNALGVNTNFVTNPIYSKEIGMDQRSVSFSITPQFLTLNTVGQTLVTDDDTSTNMSAIIRGYNNYTYSDLPSYVTNDHVQYKLHYLAFQSRFDKLIMRNMINGQKENVKVKGIHVKNYVNTGLFATIEIQKQNTTYEIESVINISANPQFIASQSVNQTLMYISSITPVVVYENGHIIEPDSYLLNIFQEQYEKIITATEKYGIQITNSNGIDRCQTITINSDWMHVGCIIDI